MNNIIYKRLSLDYIDEIVNLLVKPHSAELSKIPFYMEYALDKTNIKNKIVNMFSQNQVIGVGAFYDDKMIGYMFGIVIINKRIGKGIIVPHEGLAIDDDNDYEIVRNIYKEVSILWFNEKYFKHSVYVSLADDRYYQGFLNLSFSIEQVHGILELDDYHPFDVDEKINIRLANKSDREALKLMSNIVASIKINHHHLYQQLKII